MVEIGILKSNTPAANTTTTIREHWESAAATQSKETLYPFQNDDGSLIGSSLDLKEKNPVLYANGLSDAQLKTLPAIDMAELIRRIDSSKSSLKIKIETISRLFDNYEFSGEHGRRVKKFSEDFGNLLPKILQEFSKNYNVDNENDIWTAPLQAFELADLKKFSQSLVDSMAKLVGLPTIPAVFQPALPNKKIRGRYKMQLNKIFIYYQKDTSFLDLVGMLVHEFTHYIQTMDMLTAAKKQNKSPSDSDAFMIFLSLLCIDELAQTTSVYDHVPTEKEAEKTMLQVLDKYSFLWKKK